MNKFNLVVSALLTISTSAQSQTNNDTGIYLSINSEDGVYQKGDTVIVRASLAKEGGSEYVVKVLEGGSALYCEIAGVPIPETTVNLSTDPVEIFREVCTDQSCQKIISVAPAGSPQKASKVGFLVEPQNLAPGYEMPSDFLDYWKKQKAAMRKSKMKVVKKEVEIPDPEDAARFIAYDIEISMHEGNPARAYLVMPRNTGKKSLPICMYLHGAGVNRVAHRSTIKMALSDAKRSGGCIALDINAHGMLNDQPQEYYDSLAKGELKSYNSRPLTTREDFYYRLMFLRDLRALDFLCSLPEWDKERVFLHGSSQGGGQALALASLDDRVGAVIAVFPNMCDFGGISKKHMIGGPRFYAKESTTEFGKNILNYFDACHFLRSYKGKLFLITGARDEICNASGIYAAFNQCPSTEKDIFVFPHRGHSSAKHTNVSQRDKSVDKKMKSFCNDYLK